MQIAIILLGSLILLVLIWLLLSELKRENPEDQNEPVSEPSHQSAFIGQLENFKTWAGERLPINAERIGFTLLWGIFFFSLLDHLHTRSGFTGTLIYFLVIISTSPSQPSE